MGEVQTPEKGQKMDSKPILARWQEDKDGRSAMETLTCFVMPKRLFTATSRSEEQHPLMTATGLTGVKDAEYIPESAQKSQLPSNGKTANVLNVGCTSI